MKKYLNTLKFYVVFMIMAGVVYIVDDILLVDSYPLCLESKQCFIGAIIGGVLSAAGAAASSIMANQQLKRQKQALDESDAELKAWRDGEIFSNTLDRADSLSMVRRHREMMDEQNRKNQLSNIKGGATDEAKIAQATATNRGLADAISRIAGYGRQRQDQVETTFRNAMYNSKLKRADLAASGAQATANAVSAASGTIGNIVGSMNWGGGHVDSTPVDPDDFANMDDDIGSDEGYEYLRL